jgi:hypothetical protein
MNPEINISTIGRNILFILIGVIIFLLKRRYTGPLDDIVHAYLGNLSISFALYFNFANLPFPLKIRGLLAAAIALTIVELFEAFNGFGMMLNTYDPIDFLVNAIGIALAFWLDVTLNRISTNRLKSKSP